jgi:DNA-binding NtrC family response regulator
MTARQFTQRAEPVSARYGLDCVFLSCFADEARFLASILALSRIHLHRADTLDEADFLITATGATVLLSDVFFLDGSWANALEMVREAHPLTAAIIVADPVETAGLAGAGDLGALTVCWKPLQVTEFRGVVRQAHQATLDRMVEWGGRNPSISQVRRGC